MRHDEDEYICEDCGGTDFIGTGTCTICGGKMIPLVEFGDSDFDDDEETFDRYGEEEDEAGTGGSKAKKSFEDLREEELDKNTDDDL